MNFDSEGKIYYFMWCVLFLKGQVIWVPLKTSCKEMDHTGLLHVSLKVLRHLAVLSGRVANRRKSTHFQVKNRKTSKSAKSDKKFLLVE
jgi:hypothetical protein